MEALLFNVGSVPSLSRSTSSADIQVNHSGRQWFSGGNCKRLQGGHPIPEPICQLSPMRILRGYSFINCSCLNIAFLNYEVFSFFTDFRTQLSATDYGNFLANEPLPISTSTISDKATQILVEQFNYLRNNAVQPLAKFLEYITSGFFSLTQP